MAAPGWAQPTLVVPTTVTIGSQGQGFATVASSSPSTSEITFTVGTPDYSGDASGSTPGWLVVTPSALTTHLSQVSIVFSLRNNSTAGVNAGATAKVTLTPTSPAGVAAVTITVTFNGSGSGGGGGSNILNASANPVTFSGSSTTVNITTSSVTPITITNVAWVAGNGLNWLSAQLNTNSLSSGSAAVLTIFGNSTNLTSGVTYTGTVTLTPSVGTALTITVNFAVGGTGGSGNWSVSASTAQLNYTTGSGSFPTFAVAANNSANSAASYNVSTSSSGNWLVLFFNNGDVTGINGLTSGQSFTLKAGTQANVLGTGSYTGQAIITDSNGTQVAAVSVTLTVNGGTSQGLTISPSPLPFNAPLNGGSQSQTVTITSNVGGAVTVGAVGTPPGWLTATGPSPSSIGAGGNATFTVTANPAGLVAGSYSAGIAIGVGSQSGTLTVNLIVGGGGGTGTGNTVVAPAALTFAYQLSTDSSKIARQGLVITGPAGSWSSTIATTSGGNWLQLSPNGGNSLPDPASSNGTPIVSVNPTGLGLGTYGGTITINAGGGSQAVAVSLSVVSGPILVPSPGSLIFTAQSGQPAPNAQAVFFSDSDSTLNFNTQPISATAGNSWITPVVGSSFVSVQVNPGSLGTGTYSGSISVTQSGAANSPTTIPVLLVVNGGGTGSTGNLTFSPTSIAFTSANGSVPATNTPTLTVSAPVSTSFVGSISYTSGASGWLTVTPLSSVTNTTLSVSATAAGFAAGTYNATISFNANGQVQSVPVTLTVTTSGGGNTGNVTVSPTSFTFTAQAGSSAGAQALDVSSASGASGVTFTVQVTAGSNWLTTSANANNSTPTRLTVSANGTALQPGQYTGNIRIQPSGGNAVDVPVSLTLTAPPSVSASPTALTFDYRAGDSAPAAKPLAISGGGAALAFTVTSSSNGNWLAATPATGTTDSVNTVNVSINPTGLTIGVYNGTVTVAGANGAPGSTIVNVTLNVTAPLPTITKVTNAASYSTGSISPGEIITLFASDTTHPIGPTTAAGLALDSTGKVATTIGGVQVLINGFACPMIYASASQVSAVVPYEIKLFTTATILVRFLGQTSNGVPVNVVTTVPGLFTANSTGTGPGAILNSNNALNAPSTPASRGDTVVVYMTGEGETSPAGTTGKVTTVAAPPQPLTPVPLLPISVTIGGQPANFSFAGEAPGLVTGVLQLNVTIPANIATGEQPIVVTIGGNQSQQGVTVSVR